VYHCLDRECIVQVAHLPVIDAEKKVAFVRLAKDREQEDCWGKVIASRIPDVAVGSTVYYLKGKGVPLRDGASQFMVLDESNVLGIVEHEEAKP